MEHYGVSVILKQLLDDSENQKIKADHDTKTDGCKKDDQSGFVPAAMVFLADDEMIYSGWKHGTDHGSG